MGGRRQHLGALPKAEWRFYFADASTLGVEGLFETFARAANFVTLSLGRAESRSSLFGIISYNKLQGDIARSPILVDTGSPNQVIAADGIAYSFQAALS